MQMTVGTSAELVDTVEFSDTSSPGQVVVIQNLGPGDVYIDFTEDVTVGNGLKIGVNGAYELPRTSNESQLYIVASQASTDVRILLVD